MEKTEEEKLLKAKQKIDRIKDFYKHLVTFVLVNLFITFVWKFSFKIFGDFIVSNQFNDDGFMHIPIWLIWGIFLIADAFKTFGLGFFGIGKDWEKRKIKKFMNQQN